MSATNDGGGVALVCRGDPAREPAFVAIRQTPEGAGARLFRTRDLNDVDAAVAAGEIKRVIFARLEDLLEGCWDEVVQVDQWNAAGARVDIVEMQGMNGSRVATLAYQSWREWNAARRRRQVIAGAILSALAIGAAFLVLIR